MVFCLVRSTWAERFLYGSYQATGTPTPERGVAWGYQNSYHYAYLQQLLELPHCIHASLLSTDPSSPSHNSVAIVSNELMI